MDRYNWTKVAEEKLNPLMTRRMIHTPAMTIARICLSKGAIVPLHSHVNEQVTTLQSGKLRFVMGTAPETSEFILGPGDVLVIPPHVPHRVEALEDSTATDLFTPPREDWIRGDDSYLRAASSAGPD
jgi:quercetin dioxygenase-like cupin family protein